jgi:hypothetical protein
MLVGGILKTKAPTKAPEVISFTPVQTMVEVLWLFRDDKVGFVVVSRWPGGQWRPQSPRAPFEPPPDMGIRLAASGC